MTGLSKPWRIWCSFSGVVLILLIVICLLLFVEDSRQEAQYVKEELLPVANYVANFRDQNHRLPSQNEFESWQDQNKHSREAIYYSEKPGFMKDWGVEGHDFIVGNWEGDAFEYYRSWDGRTFLSD